MEIHKYNKEELKIVEKTLLAGASQYDFNILEERIIGIRILKKSLILEGYSEEYFDFQKQLLLT